MPLPAERADEVTAPFYDDALPTYRARFTGCTVCGIPNTVWMSSFVGPRCSAHPPRFEPERAVSVALDDPHAALMYAAADFPEETA